MRFTFTRDPAEPASPFALGDLEITGPDGTVTSAGRTPDQSFMVYLGIGDLAYGLAELAEGRRRDYEFVGPDSSFILVFTKRRGRISVRAYGRSLGDESAEEVLAGLVAGIDSFLADPANTLPPSDAVARDLDQALAELRNRQS